MPRQYVSAARGPKWSPERGTLWVEAYRRIGNVTFACDAVGITTKTFYDWMHKGEVGEPEFEAFYFDAKLARSQRASELITRAETDKGGPAFLLERLFPAEFGQHGRSFQDAMQTIIDAVLPRLTDAAAREVVDALASIQRERSGISEPGVADGEATGAGSAVIDVDGESVAGALPSSTEPHP